MLKYKGKTYRFIRDLGDATGIEPARLSKAMGLGLSVEDAVDACSADGTVLMELESYHRAESWLLETGRSDKVDTHSYISRIARMNRDAGQLKYSYKGIYWK